MKSAKLDAASTRLNAMLSNTMEIVRAFYKT
jgi:hypothetical protein